MSEGPFARRDIADRELARRPDFVVGRLLVNQLDSVFADKGALDPLRPPDEPVARRLVAVPVSIPARD